MRKSPWALGWLAVWLAACSDGRPDAIGDYETGRRPPPGSAGPPATFEELEADPGFPGTPGDAESHADLFAYEPLPAECTVPNVADLNARTELRIFQGNGVSDADLRFYLGGLQRYFTQYGVHMFTRYEVIPVPLDYAMTFDLDSIAAKVERETGIDIDGPVTAAEEAEASRAIGRAILHNTRELVRVYGTPRRDAINVVVLEHMLSGNLPRELADFDAVAGLGVSTELLESFAPNDPARELYEWLDIEDDMTPTAIVAVEPVRRFDVVPDIVIAHEVGHAYGLVHVSDDDNLLNQGLIDCWLSLSNDQLNVVRESTARFAHTLALGPDQVSLTNRAAEFVQALTSGTWRHR